MSDCSSELLSFHNKRVRLSQEEQKLLREHRDANRKRVADGLARDEGPAPLRNIPQGSYAMRTINQEPEGAYDIDDGIVFKASDLVGPNGAPLTSLAARKMVLAAAIDGTFSTPPELKPNCVRVHYAEGHHVDIPVYRESIDDNGNPELEIASSSWQASNPEAVTAWFNGAVIAKSPDETNGRQMRRIVRLLKKFAKSRRSWNMPSGFVLSVLVDESYLPALGRDDKAFVETIQAISERLAISGLVPHPVVDEYLVDDEKDARIATLKDKIGWALNELAALSGFGCTKLKALRAWKATFNTDFFDGFIEDEKGRTQAVAASLVTKTKVQPSPWSP